MSQPPQPHVGLFVTCLADLMRPSVAFCTIQLLEAAGCKVDVPNAQTCCGQPGYNSGAAKKTLPLAKQVISTFEHYDYVVAPSGSCAGMIREHYPRLFDEADEWHARALALAEKTWEITGFLVDVLDFRPEQFAVDSSDKVVTYHDSCAGLREMNIQEQPRRLLQDMAGIEINEMPDSNVCCGFGGTFCAKMPEISAKMVDDKLANAAGVEADLLLGGDLGCLLNISGRASRAGKAIEVRHVVEVLADKLDGPAIGEGQS